MENTKLKTVSGFGTASVEAKKSEFIACVYPVETEEEALTHLAEVKKHYADARHHVYAYIINNNNITRYSDDSEPSGTAGMPVLDTMRKQCITDTLIVVTRYFGGTLLGTGGLVRAYSDAAKAGLDAAEIVLKCTCDVTDIVCDYNTSGKVEYKLKQDNINILDTAYAEKVTFTIATFPEDTKTFTDALIDLTNGSIETFDKGQKTFKLKDKNNV